MTSKSLSCRTCSSSRLCLFIRSLTPSPPSHPPSPFLTNSSGDNVIATTHRHPSHTSASRPARRNRPAKLNRAHPSGNKNLRRKRRMSTIPAGYLRQNPLGEWPILQSRSFYRLDDVSNILIGDILPDRAGLLHPLV